MPSVKRRRSPRTSSAKLNSEQARTALKQQIVATLTRMEREGALVPSTDGKDPAFIVDVYSTQLDFRAGIVRIDIAVRPVRAIRLHLRDDSREELGARHGHYPGSQRKHGATRRQTSGRVRSIEYRQQQSRDKRVRLGSAERIGMTTGAQLVEGRLRVASASPTLARSPSTSRSRSARSSSTATPR
jgi:hypothetical protein